MEYQRQPDQQEQKQQYGGVGLAGKGAKEHNPGVERQDRGTEPGAAAAEE